MTKIFTRTSPEHSLLALTTTCRPYRLLVGLGLLLTTACGDDFSPTSNTTSEDSTDFEPFPTTTSNGPRPTQPTAGDTSDGATMASDAPSSGSPDCEGDASLIGPSRCAPKPDTDAPPAPPGPDGDAGAPKPPAPPAHDGDAGAPKPPPPPAHDGDAGAPKPPPPPAHDGDAAAPKPPKPPAAKGDGGAPEPPGSDVECGAEGERCCGGPGGGCDQGLTCANPNGPPLDDSECVAGE